MSVRLSLAALVAALLLAPVSASAESSTADVPIAVEVSNGASIYAMPWYLGKFNPLSTVPVDSVGAIEVTATPGTAYSIFIGPGRNATPDGRRAQKTGASGDYLSYEIFTDAQRTTPWPAVPGPSGQVQSTGTGEVQRHPVYLRVPLPQNVRPGTYSDIVQLGVVY